MFHALLFLLFMTRIMCSMTTDELKTFVSAMQAGIDVFKFTRAQPKQIHPRTLFIDKEVTRLCWLPTGRLILFLYSI